MSKVFLQHRRFDSTIGGDWLRSKGHGHKLDIEGLWVLGPGIPAWVLVEPEEASLVHPLQSEVPHWEPEARASAEALVRRAEVEALWVQLLRQALPHPAQPRVRISLSPLPVVRRPS